MVRNIAALSATLVAAAMTELLFGRYLPAFRIEDGLPVPTPLPLLRWWAESLLLGSTLIAGLALRGLDRPDGGNFFFLLCCAGALGAALAGNGSAFSTTFLTKLLAGSAIAAAVVLLWQRHRP